MKNRVQLAVSLQEKKAVFNFRYKIYIEELHKMHINADHENKLLFDECDDFAKIYYARTNNGIAATVRTQRGCEGYFSKKEIDLFDIELFEEIIAHKQLAVTDRLMVKKEFRYSMITHEMMLATYADALKDGVLVCFISCEEKLLSLYLRYGFRIFGSPVFLDNGEPRYRLIICVHDHEHLKKMRSPFLSLLPETLDDKGFCKTLIEDKLNLMLIDNIETLKQQSFIRA